VAGDGVTKLKPEYRPTGVEHHHSQTADMFAVDHYKETGRIQLQGEVRAILLKRKRDRKTLRQKPESRAPMRRRSSQGERAEMRL
jgi:hypothetical protein